MDVAYEQQTHFRSSLLSLRLREATTGNASAVRRLVWAGLLTIVLIYKYDKDHFVFFNSFIFNSVNSEALICMRKPNSEGF